ncbi:MAG: hypothetical protein QF718_05660 [Phycisphaerales bacterium]|jgi:hypothetical protein|nr:hypothetical protein [Phycisphaerales bacterium]
MTINLISAVISTACAISAQTIDHKDVSKAIEMITAELIERYDQNRCWEPINSSGWLSKHNGGTTSIATLALLASGESIHSPKIQRSLDFLMEIEDPSTYVLAIRTSIWSMFPDRYKKNLRNDTKRLVNSMSIPCGGWGTYYSPPQSLAKTSPLIREFGMIALREAGRSGAKVPKDCWSAIANATLTTQHKNGGWSYQQSGTQGKATANMTVAGINCLLGVGEVYGDDLSKNDTTWLHGSLNKAIQWLNKHATTDKNSGGTALMSYLYSLERTAMACGLAEIHNRDWFLDGAKAVLESHCDRAKARGSTVNLSFALLFLTRGRAPTALCELGLENSQVDPMRLADIIAKRVSNRTEQILGWQLVTENDSIDSWLSSPFMLIQNVTAIPDDCSKIRKYLDKGGLIVILATGKEHKFFTKFADKLCPNISKQRITGEHWALSLLENTKARVTSWNDGVRDRILIIQGSTKLICDNENNRLSKVMMNICCGAAELDHWKNRLEKNVFSFSRKQIVIAKHDRSWNTEIAGLNQWNTKILPIKEAKNKTLVLVGGIDNEEVNEKLTDDIILIASSGSTVLVESIGGLGGFANSVRNHVEAKCNLTSKPELDLIDDPCRRGWSIRNNKKIGTPSSITIGKGRILFVDCDIRNALLNQPCWGVHGYDYKSAVRLIESLLKK